MVVYVCRQDCVFDGLVPRRCVVGVGDCGVCVVFIYGRGEWCGWRCAILYGRGEWRGWVFYLWFVYDARRYVRLLMGCVCWLLSWCLAVPDVTIQYGRIPFSPAMPLSGIRPFMFCFLQLAFVSL